AELQFAAMPPEQLDEVVALQDHIVELEEGEVLLALEPELDGVALDHLVDRDVAPDLAQELDIVQAKQPLGVVDHQRIGAAVAEFQEFGENLLDAALVRLDLLGGKNPAALVLAGWVPDASSAAAHQRDGPVPGVLQPAQKHDLHQAADVQARRCAVEADI